ncbi:hypothetical protein GT022_05330 [Agaribacter marinus]|uniref:Uncharacterized protein n=1 Tax=Virgibacillus salarius TaxID=447199 RepID=A0A941IBR5_9BACI|nr:MULTISPECIES: hypothetical protein [Bacillaceae]MBR7795465.1 hypothetical protein [Virgibacillus salarius]NAZ08178.1 hypothetical protein [Agaribacter marinus]WBX80490.1 hypothetical protein PD280_00970 [Virgibacillus salarius]
MKEWWERKKVKTSRRKIEKENYTFWNVILDVLCWIPELVILPIRLVYWLIKSVGRMLRNIVDF